MPKVPIDYNNTIIYKLEHIEKDDLVYVGHTTNWDRRKYSHKQRCNNKNDTKHNLKLYKMMRENGGWDKFRMIEVEKYPCLDRREADKREMENTKELKANLNTYKSYITKEEKKEQDKTYREENKDKMNDYYENNKQIFAERNKLRYETNKEMIKEKCKDYRIKNEIPIKIKRKEYDRKYREKNEDKIKDSMKKYLDNNNEKRKLYMKVYYQKKKEEKANKL